MFDLIAPYILCILIVIIAFGALLIEILLIVIMTSLLAVINALAGGVYLLANLRRVLDSDAVGADPAPIAALNNNRTHSDICTCT
jgi:hypothetical protein